MNKTNHLSKELELWSSVCMRFTMQELLSFAKQHDLSLMQLDIIVLLEREADCDITSICKHMMVTRSAASQMVERLYKAGLVFRQDSPTDRRVKFIRLTEKGEQIAQKRIELRRTNIEHVVEGIPEELRDQISESLGILNQTLATTLEIE